MTYPPDPSQWYRTVRVTLAGRHAIGEGDLTFNLRCQAFTPLVNGNGNLLVIRCPGGEVCLSLTGAIKHYSDDGTSAVRALPKEPGPITLEGCRELLSQNTDVSFTVYQPAERQDRPGLPQS
jgi:hypothetical protein